MIFGTSMLPCSNAARLMTHIGGWKILRCRHTAAAGTAATDEGFPQSLSA